MEKLNHWLVEINDIELEKNVIINVIQLANHLKPKSIKILYISKEIDFLDDIYSDYPDFQKTNQQSIKQELEVLISEKLLKTIEFEIEIIIGNPLTEVLKRSQGLDIDLILIGNQDDFSKLDKKIIRKAPCSVLVVPSRLLIDIKSILIPVDHSEYTQLSFDTAKEFTDNYEVQDIKAIHLYRDATHYLNRVFESPFEVNELLAKQQTLNEKLESYANFKINELIENQNSLRGLKGETVQLRKGKEISEYLSEQLNGKNPDLIIMGARGKTASAGNLLGSVTENLRADLKKSLLYVVKNKGENVGFIRSLLNLAS
ncbi:universal stress protein [Fulvivirga lutimaris]|uniref:universal stress protein n=1 Tax=Fulvivirga lutimaris TaxID=1819566 RepID=UPI0012BCAED4|nr:universal stress protein [Fulvivirga lutimaris]MTI38110.1 hypothetical protein [Fulvivirga lutimaris]